MWICSPCNNAPAHRHMINLHIEQMPYFRWHVLGHMPAWHLIRHYSEAQLLPEDRIQFRGAYRAGKIATCRKALDRAVRCV